MADTYVRATLTIGDGGIVSPRYWIGQSLPVRIQFTDRAGLPVAVTGARLLARLAGSEVPIQLAGADLTAAGLGTFLVAPVLDPDGTWYLRGDCAEMAPDQHAADEVSVVVRASNALPAAPASAPLLLPGAVVASTSDPQGTLITSLAEMDALTGDEVLVGVQGGNARRVTVDGVFTAAGEAAAEAIAEDVAQVDGDAMAVEAARAQVVGIRDDLPGDITTEITTQAPGLISGAIQTQVDPKVALAQAARAAAELAAQIAAAASRSYATTAAAQADAALAVGTQFMVPGATSFDLYRKETGLPATLLGAYPNKAALDAQAALVRTAEGDFALGARDDLGFYALTISLDGRMLKAPGFTLQFMVDGTARLSRPDGTGAVDLRADGAVSLGGLTFATGGGGLAATDSLGFTALRINADGSTEAGGVRLAVVDGVPTLLGTDGSVLMRAPVGGNPIFTGTIPSRTVDIPGVAFAVSDDLNFLGSAVRSDGSPLVAGPGVTVAQGWTTTELAAKDNRNLALANARSRQREDYVYRLTRSYSAFVTVGQSFAANEYGWPHVTQTNRFPGLLMLGVSVSPAPVVDDNNAVYVPRGAGVLNPLVGTTDHKSFPTILTEADILALDRVNATNYAEGVLPGALAFLRQGWNDRFGVADDAGHKWVGGASAFGGMPKENLSKGHASGRYLRFGDFLKRVKAITGSDLGLGAVFDLQGEANYNGTTLSDGTTRAARDKEAYKALQRQYVADHRADYQVGLLGQTRPTPWITYQTGGIHTKDDFDMGVGMAQWELSEELQAYYLACPHYFMPKNGTHPTGNSYRWLGQHFGKVHTRVVLDGNRWRPLSPVSLTGAATLRDREILLDVHVPHPPIVFDIPYVTTTDVPNKGFAVVDGVGQTRSIAINSVEIVGNTMIRLTLNRRPDLATARLRYADETHDGLGSVRDSDPTAANELFLYQPERNAHPADNVPALIGKPYPLHNWLIGFSIPLVQG